MAIITSTDLSESTKNAYNTRLAKWLEIGGGWTMDFLVNHHKEALAVLAATDKIKHSPRNHHNFISAVVAYLNYEHRDSPRIKVWRQLQKDNTEPIRQHYLTGKPTELQKDKVMSWSKILKVRDDLPMGKTKLLLAMYTYLNPVRADYFRLASYLKDYDDHRIVENENYILFDNKTKKHTLTLVDYKTVKKYGKIVLDIPKPLCDMFDTITHTVELNDILGNNYIFEGEKGDPFSRQTFSQWANRRLTKVFQEAYEQPMTLTALRHIFTSQLDSNRPVAELHAIGQSMGHNIAQQRLYKWEDLNGQGKNEVIVPSDTEKTE
jgi:hypothetical protein